MPSAVGSTPSSRAEIGGPEDERAQARRGLGDLARGEHAARSLGHREQRDARPPETPAARSSSSSRPAT